MLYKRSTAVRSPRSIQPSAAARALGFAQTAMPHVAALIIGISLAPSPHGQAGNPRSHLFDLALQGFALGRTVADRAGQPPSQFSITDLQPVGDDVLKAQLNRHRIGELMETAG